MDTERHFDPRMPPHLRNLFNSFDALSKKIDRVLAEARMKRNRGSRYYNPTAFGDFFVPSQNECGVLSVGLFDSIRELFQDAPIQSHDAEYVDIRVRVVAQAVESVLAFYEKLVDAQVDDVLKTLLACDIRVIEKMLQLFSRFVKKLRPFFEFDGSAMGENTQVVVEMDWDIDQEVDAFHKEFQRIFGEM